MSWLAEISGSSEITDVTKIKTNRALDTIGTAEITIYNPWGTKNGEYKSKYFEPVTVKTSDEVYTIFDGRIEDIKIQGHDLILQCMDYGRELNDNKLYNKKFTYVEGYIKIAGLNTGSSTITSEMYKTGGSFSWTTDEWANKPLTFDSKSNLTTHTADAGDHTKALSSEYGTFDLTQTDGSDYWRTTRIDQATAADADFTTYLDFTNVGSVTMIRITVRVKMHKSATGTSAIAPALYLYNKDTATYDEIKDLNWNDTNLVTVDITSNVDSYNDSGTVRLGVAGGVYLWSGQYHTYRYWYYAKLEVGNLFVHEFHEIWSNTATALTLKRHHHPGSGETAVYGAFPLVYDTGCYNIKSHDDTGNLMATYSFASDAVGAEPAGWTTTEGADTSALIVASQTTHMKCWKFLDNGAATYVYADSDAFTSAQTAGTIEFWIYIAYVASNGNFEVVIKSGADYKIVLNFSQATHKIINNANEDICSFTEDAWHHIRIAFDCATDTFEFWYDGVKQGTTWAFYAAATSLDGIRLYSSSLSGGDAVYFDAIDYSWDTATGNYQVPYFTNRNRYFAKKEAFGGMPYVNPLGSCGIATGDTFKIIERNSNIVANLVNLQGVNLSTGESTVSTGDHFSGLNCESRTSWDIVRQLAEESECRVWVDTGNHFHFQTTGDMPTGSAWTEANKDFLQHPLITYSPEEYRSACIVIGKNCTGDMQTGIVFNNVARTEVIKNEGCYTKEECNAYALAYLGRYNNIEPAMTCAILDKYDLDLGQKQTITCQTLTGEVMIVEGIQREYVAGETGYCIGTVRLGNLPTNLSPQEKIVHYFGQLKQKLAEVNAYK